MPAEATSKESIYSRLVESLKKATGDDLWFHLALWLKNEGIREPEDWLPANIYSRLTQEPRKRLQGISFTDMWHYELVRCWERYFAALLHEKRKRSKSVNLKKGLVELGYEPKSVEIIMSKNWRSPVAPACEWLATRDILRPKTENADAATMLRNAYSRVNAGVKQKFRDHILQHV